MTQGSQGNVPPESRIKPTKQGGELEKMNDIETEIDAVIQALGKLRRDLTELRNTYPQHGGTSS
ncbi:MAG: hypothetical protein JOZ81_10090 [Chloroflexi bacterium]|nr:hypothetical protein [Chloroflexota bacterium]MBV9543653.1 hypothetical protein [Chloroflexota bacterium]